MRVRVSDTVITREIPALTLRELVESERQLGRAERVFAIPSESALEIQLHAQFTAAELRWFRGPVGEV